MPAVNAVSFRHYPSIESICRLVREAGFDTIELSRPRFYAGLTTPETRRRFADWTSEIGLRLYGFDCWVEVEPYTAFDETLADFGRAVNWAAELELRMIISHDPWRHVNGGRAPGECMAINLELFRRVADLCAAKQLQLVFEPHPDTLSMQNAWAIEFIDTLAEGHPAGSVGILYDCCHYGVGQPEAYVDTISELGERIRHVHYSDGDRETYALHLAPGDGSLDLSAIDAALERIGYRGSLTSDVYNNPLLEDCARRSAPRVRALGARLGIHS
ncbi:MAG: sugar phosphate isomerase/epimerase [Planctomycetales bacterium]|nr:sugar phosphate isomerase/epimerase [Planctomycetales bacterium]